MSQAENSGGQYYILVDGEILTASLLDWALWFESTDRGIDKTQLRDSYGAPVEVSTAFLGLNHRFTGEGPPLIFETLVFGGPLDGEGSRSSTVGEAKARHAEWVERSKAAGCVIGGQQ